MNLSDNEEEYSKFVHLVQIFKASGIQLSQIINYLEYIDHYNMTIQDVMATTISAFFEPKPLQKRFDVFLCHNSEDKLAVKAIGEELIQRGYTPWLDEWELPPGQRWLPILEQQMKQVQAVAIFVGKLGTGPWQDEEIEGLLRQYKDQEESYPIIPVILPDCPDPPRLPFYLHGRTWVDFRHADPNPLYQLIWGITGERPE